MRLIKKIVKKIKGIDSEYSYNIYENGELELMKKIFEFIDNLLQKTGKIGDYDQKI